VQVLGAGVYPLHLIIPAVGLGIAAALALVTRHTVYGKALLAVVQSPQAARLVGVRVETATSAAYALSTIFAGVAGVLIAPLVTVSAGMGWVFGIKAFAAAILGGLDSAWGVVVAGHPVRCDRGAGDDAAGIDVHECAVVRRRHPRAGPDAARAPRPRGRAPGLTCAVRSPAWASCWPASRCAVRRRLPDVSPGPGGVTALVGTGLNVLMGLAGQISIGHVGFFAIGGYVTALLTKDLGMASGPRWPRPVSSPPWWAARSRSPHCACRGRTWRW
jgi:ABC-type branched-subunit amino acid transport system permease subunit